MAEENTGADLAAQLEAANTARQEAEDRAAVLATERDNYKVVALKRKGKLEDDTNFFGDHDEADVEKLIGEKTTMVQKEREATRKLEAAEAARLKAEGALAEVLRAKDNVPGASVGAAAGGGQAVGDAIFSDAQVGALQNKWTRMGFSEEAQKRMLETEKKSALARKSVV